MTQHKERYFIVFGGLSLRRRYYNDERRRGGSKAQGRNQAAWKGPNRWFLQGNAYITNCSFIMFLRIHISGIF